MRKILLLCLLVMLICVPAYAAEVDDAKQIVSDLKEISYRYESGLSYAKFNELYGDVYVKVRKFEDAYPGSELVSLAKAAVEPYGDAKDVWKSTLGDKTKDYKNMSTMIHKNELMKKYPGIDERIKKDTLTLGNKTGPVWNYNSTIGTLFNIGSDRTKELQDKIAAQ